LFISAFVIQSCRDESLNPVPKWESGLHAYTIFDGIAFDGKPLSRPQPYEKNNAKNFPADGQDDPAVNVPFKIRWVSLDNKLTVAKIDVYIKMFESYVDPAGNPQKAELSGGTGKLLTSITAPTGNRQWNAFKVTPTQIYNLFKDATVKYDKVNATKVFENPKKARPKGQWFDGKTDEFQIFWKLTSTEGLVYESWGPNLCGDPTAVSEANSNCTLNFTINGCEFKTTQFDAGNWTVDVDTWQDFKIGTAVRVKGGPGADQITVEATATDVDHKDLVLTVTDKFTGAVKINKQAYGIYKFLNDPNTYSAEGSGNINGCAGVIDIIINHTGSDGSSYPGYKFKVTRK
jgi:hypothetical protein